jgi:hypothetical protein
MGNMERANYLGAFRDLGRLVRIGRCVPLPLAFSQEAFLGMAVCGEVRRLWSSYAALLGTTSAAVGGGRSEGGIDLSVVLRGVSAEDVAAFKARFEEEDEIVGKLIGGLEALPETGKQARKQSLSPFLPPSLLHFQVTHPFLPPSLPPSLPSSQQPATSTSPSTTAAARSSASVREGKT